MSKNLATIWRYWLAFTMWFGTVQMLLILTVIYWLVVPFIGVPLRILKDPLKQKLNTPAEWIPRESGPLDVETMRNQF